MRNEEILRTGALKYWSNARDAQSIGICLDDSSTGRATHAVLKIPVV